MGGGMRGEVGARAAGVHPSSTASAASASPAAAIGARAFGRGRSLRDQRPREFKTGADFTASV